MKQNFLLCFFILLLITLTSSSILNKINSLSRSSLQTANTFPTSLHAGQILHQGSAIFSNNHNYILVLQKDGNLVILNTITNSPLWSSNTSEKGQGPYRLALLYTGNLVIYDKYNGMVWATANTSNPSDEYILRLSDEGILNIKNIYSQEIWSNTRNPNTSFANLSNDISNLQSKLRTFSRNSLNVGENLYVGMSLVSQNSVYNATLLSNGRFQIIKTEINNKGDIRWNNFTHTFEVYYPKVSSLVWSTQNAYIQGGNLTLSLQSNGILSLLDINNTSVWNSHSYVSPDSNYSLFLNNNGNLIISDGINSIWDIQGNINNFINTRGNFLTSGSSIVCGESLVTSDKQFALQLLNNGNLELNYFPGNTTSKTTVWESNTANLGSYPYKLIMERSGKLVIVDSQKSILWSSKTRSPLSSLSLENNGQLIILNSNYTIIYQLFVSTTFKFPIKITNFPRNKLFMRSVLYVNQELFLGGSLVSSNLNYQLRISSKGGLQLLYFPQTVYDHQNFTIIWNSKVSKKAKKSSRLHLRNDGNIVLFDDQNNSVWVSGSSSKKSNNYYLWISNSGSLRIVNSLNNRVLWKLIMKRRKPSLKVKSTALVQGKSLKQGYSLVSNNKKYALTVGNGDLNLVFYNNTISDLSINQTIWSTHTNNTGRAPYKMKLMNNGNLILIDSVGLLIWQSNSFGTTNSSYFLSVQDDGEISIYNSNLVPIWDTKQYYKNFSSKFHSYKKNNTNSSVNINNRSPHSSASNWTTHLFKLSEEGVLLQNQSLISFNNKFLLNITTSGNLVIINRNNNKHIWSSNTKGKHYGPFKLFLNKNGNLVLLNKNSTIVWQTKTFGKPNQNYFVYLSNVGNLVIYNNDYEAIWDSRGRVKNHKRKITPSFLIDGTALKSNQSLYSENKKFTLDLSDNGNLIIYSYPINYFISDGREQIWSSNTSNKGISPYLLTLRPNGNLVLTDKERRVIWSTGTRSKGLKNFRAKLLDNGVLTMFQGNKVLWDSKSGSYKYINQTKSRSHKPILKKINPQKSELQNPTLQNIIVNKPNNVTENIHQANRIPPLSGRIGKDTFGQNEQLLENEYLFSANSKYTVEVSDSANLNIFFYPETVDNLHNRTLIWSSNTVTNQNGPFKLVLSPKGNLNIVTQNEDKIVWSSYSKRKRGHYFARIENTGNFVVYKKKNNKPIWDTMGLITRKHDTLLQNRMVPFLLVDNILYEGGMLFSDNLKYTLQLQNNGNIVIFNYPNGFNHGQYNRNIVWSTNINRPEGSPYRLKLQKDGVIVVKDNSGIVIWRSNSKQAKHSKKYYLKLFNDGNLVIMDKYTQPVWDLYNQFYNAANLFKTNTLYAGQYLKMGTSLFSNNRLYSLDVQFDGNLVIYKYPYGLTHLNNRQPIWFTNNNNMQYASQPYRLKLTINGNLVLLDKYKNVIWSSESHERKANLNYKLVLKNNGNLVVLNHKGKIIWSSY